MTVIAHIHRRDLRIHDNSSLEYHASENNAIIPFFIFDPRQLQGEYYSQNAFEFMIESLKELNEEYEKKDTKLHTIHDEFEKALEKIKKAKIDGISINKDYTPFSIKRDKQIKQFCKENDLEFYEFDDALLTKPENSLKKDGNPYTVFTPYYKNAMNLPIQKPTLLNKTIKFEKINSIKTDFPEIKNNPNKIVQGGRKEALTLLENAKSLDYKNQRDYPHIKGTSMLSAHHKFGTISARESLEQFKNISETLVSELYWRDFYTQIAYFFPKVFGKSFKSKYDAIKWSENKDHLEKWKKGKTGYPIVDAGMKELNETGYMHNRVRMITASFLCKHLLIDWREGEKYFAQKLTDYDPSVNNGSWQWAASTGCDAQPYFRIFNPWRQQERFDKNCKYIKKWLPELAHLDVKQIHKLDEQRPLNIGEYPMPVVEHKKAREKALQTYKAV